MCLFYRACYTVWGLMLPKYKTFAADHSHARNIGEFYARHCISTGFACSNNSFFRRRRWYRWTSSLLRRTYHHSRWSNFSFRRPICLVDDQFPGFFNILSGVDLVQIVHGLTHRARHMLDVVIARTDIAVSVVVDLTIFSDPSLVTSEFLFRPGEETHTKVIISKREWKALNVDTFCSYLQPYTRTRHRTFQPLFMPTTKHYIHCWTSTFQPKKLWSGVTLRPHGFRTRKSSQDDLNGDTASRISRMTIVHSTSSLSVNGPFSSATRVRVLLVKDYRLLPRLQVALAED